MSSLQAGDLFSVKGIVAVVTGGGTGIGLMMTKALVRNGADKVYIIGRRKEALDEATRLDSDHIIPIMGDVTSQGSLSAVADRIWADVGYVNLVIANAGSPGARASPIKADSGIAKVQADLQGVSMADFVNTFAINTAGVYYTLVEFLGLLDAGNRKGNVEQKSHFITTSSVSAFNRQATGSLAYGASKAATIQLMKALSTQMTPLGIRSNVIVPGLYPTDMTTASFCGKDGTTEGSFPPTSIPLTRGGKEEDMAGTILYLASKAGAYCSGCILVTDGGRTGIFPSSY